MDKPHPDDLAVAKAQTQAVYSRRADVWHEGRDGSLYERVWIDRLLADVPPKGRVLDLGCGSGAPLAGYLLGQGFDLLGIDYAEPMIALAKATYPQGQWRVGDMRALDDIGSFDAIYSWDGFFHLSVREQREALPELARHLNPNGALLLTVGTSEGEVTGTVGGETVYHASLSPTEYEQTLRDLGFTSVIYKAEDPDCMGRSVLIAMSKNNENSTRRYAD